MRKIRLLLVAAVALFALVGFAPHAAAQEDDTSDEGTEESHDIGHAEHLCVELLEEGGTIDDCQAAPNQLLPETNEIIWGAFGFLVVFFFVAKFGYPAIKKSMNDRTERI